MTDERRGRPATARLAERLGPDLTDRLIAQLAPSESSQARRASAG
jgi:hypothetical protein